MARITPLTGLDHGSDVVGIHRALRFPRLAALCKLSPTLDSLPLFGGPAGKRILVRRARHVSNTVKCWRNVWKRLSLPAGTGLPHHGGTRDARHDVDAVPKEKKSMQPTAIAVEVAVDVAVQRQRQASASQRGHAG